MKNLNNFIKQHPFQFIYLAGVVLPGVCLVLTLNLLRILSFEPKVGFLGALDTIKGALFMLLGLTLLGAVSLHWIRAVRGRVALIAFWQAVWVLLGILEIAGHQFFTATGSTLDYYLLAFSLQNFTDNAEVIGSEVPRWVLATMPGYALLVLGLPWAGYIWLRDTRLAQREREGTGIKSRAWGIVGLILGLFCLVAASATPWSGRRLPLASPTAVTVTRTAAEAVTDALQPEDDVETDLLDISLERREEFGPAERRNVVVIVLESTRASAVTPYNPDLATTPFLDELATRSTLVEHAYSIVPHSSKALVAILCGLEPNLSMPITEALADNIPGRCLAELLGEQGYRTKFFQSAREDFENRRQLVKNMGYQEFMPGNEMDSTGFSRANYFGFEDDVMLEPSKKWLEQNTEEPLFITYFTVTPHHPYDAPTRYGRHNFADEDLLNRYLNSIHYLDNFVKNLLDQYQALGLLEKSIFVIVGDHGEGLGEHGRSQHDNVIYEEGIRVPMMIFDPQDPTPRRIKYNANHLDLAPSILDRLGFNILQGQYPGSSIWSLNGERGIHAHCWYERRCMARIVGDEKYIHHFNTQPDEFFDLAADPDERDDIAATRQDLSDWLKPLWAWRAEVIGVHRTHTRQHLKDIVTDKLPKMTHPVDAQFGSAARLRGYDISRTSVRGHQPIRLTWYFESLETLGPQWQLFVHAQHENGKLKNFDHIPAGGLAPIDDWRPGSFIVDKHTIRLPKSWPPGEVKIYLGLWNTETKKRKKLSGDVPHDGKNRAQVTTIELLNKDTGIKK